MGPSDVEQALAKHAWNPGLPRGWSRHLLGTPHALQLPLGPRTPAGRLQSHWNAQMWDLLASWKREPSSRTTRTLATTAAHRSCALIYSLRRTAPGVSLRATMGVPLRARTALLLAWALGPELARSQPRGLPAPALGSSGAAVAARRRPLSRTGFVPLGILVAGHRETSCRDARGQSRLASACPHRAPGPTFVLFPAATHRRAGRLGLWPRRLPGLEGRPTPEEGLLLVCARPSRLDSSYRPSSPLMFWSFLMLYSFVRNQVLWLPAPLCCFRKKRGSWGWHHTQLVLFLRSRPRPARCTTLGRSNGTREPWQLGEGTDLG